MKTISVTTAHIAAGKPKDERCCPIALALGEVFGATFEVIHLTPIIGARRWCATRHDADGDEVSETILPVECGTFALRFDQRLPVEPFEFEFEEGVTS